MADVTHQEVIDLLRKWSNAYDNSDDAFFDYFSKDASFFTVSSPTRIDGTEEFRRGFEPHFKQYKRRSQLLSPEVRISGNTAVVSLHSRILIDGRANNLQTSIIVAKDDQGNVRIVHLHNSPLSVPAIPQSLLGVGAHNLDEIALLEERVATAAAAVGTPK